MTREVPLTRGMVAVVDDEDYDRVLAAGPWHAFPGKRTWYARHTYRDSASPSGYGGVFMHALVSDLPNVDHANLDGLDNRRANLRPASPTEQARNRRRRSDNRSGYVGVHARPGGRWVAGIRHDGRQHHLGTFATAEQAARAYDASALTHFGDFARLNFPEGIAS